MKKRSIHRFESREAPEEGWVAWATFTHGTRMGPGRTTVPYEAEDYHMMPRDGIVSALEKIYERDPCYRAEELILLLKEWQPQNSTKIAAMCHELGRKSDSTFGQPKGDMSPAREFPVNGNAWYAVSNILGTRILSGSCTKRPGWIEAVERLEGIVEQMPEPVLRDCSIQRIDDAQWYASAYFSSGTQKTQTLSSPEEAIAWCAEFGAPSDLQDWTLYDESDILQLSFVVL